MAPRSINDGIEALKELGKKNYFELQWHQDAVGITLEYLSKFDVIILLNTTGDIFADNEKRAIEKFIQSGKGFVGIHSASDTELGWLWYSKLVGRMFIVHPKIQSAKIYFTAKDFIGLEVFQMVNYGQMNGMNLVLKKQTV